MAHASRRTLVPAAAEPPSWRVHIEARSAGIGCRAHVVGPGAPPSPCSLPALIRWLATLDAQAPDCGLR